LDNICRRVASCTGTCMIGCSRLRALTSIIGSTSIEVIPTIKHEVARRPILVACLRPDNLHLILRFIGSNSYHSFRQTQGTASALPGLLPFSMDFNDACHLYDRRFLLTTCKAGGFLVIRVHASESLPIRVKNSNLPMVMFSPLVFLECRAFLKFHLQILTR